MARVGNRQWAGRGRVLMVSAMSLGASMVAPALGSASRAAIDRPPSAPSATLAKTTSLNETGHLRLTSKHNFTLNERGSASGTIAGTIYVHLTAVSSTRVTVQVNIYPRGGSISGSGTGSYRRQGATAQFAGAMSFSRGTGRYAHVHGSGLSFSGTIEESNHDAITVHVSGRVSG
jgi:hypothetical protein